MSHPATPTLFTVQSLDPVSRAGGRTVTIRPGPETRLEADREKAVGTQDRVPTLQLPEKQGRKVQL